MRQCKVQPETQMRQSHDNAIVRKKQSQKNTRRHSTVVLLLFAFYILAAIKRVELYQNRGSGGHVEMKIVPSKANNSSQYSSNRRSLSSTSTIFSSHTQSFISRSWSLSSNAEKRSHGAERWSLRVCDISSWSKSAVVRNFIKRVCRSVRSERARSSLICM